MTARTRSVLTDRDGAYPRLARTKQLVHIADVCRKSGLPESTRTPQLEAWPAREPCLRANAQG